MDMQHSPQPPTWFPSILESLSTSLTDPPPPSVRAHPRTRGRETIFDKNTNMDDALKGQVIDTLEGYLGVACHPWFTWASHRLLWQNHNSRPQRKKDSNEWMNPSTPHKRLMSSSNELMTAFSMPTMVRSPSCLSRFFKVHIIRWAPPFITMAPARFGTRKQRLPEPGALQTILRWRKPRPQRATEV